jgi:hypothetical protein
MPALWLAQLLCPQRHCILALAYDIEEHKPADIEEKLNAAMTLKVINPWCGICRSRHLHVEHGKLSTDDWDEAMVMLRANEAAQLATRAILGDQNRN